VDEIRVFRGITRGLGQGPQRPHRAVEERTRDRLQQARAQGRPEERSVRLESRRHGRPHLEREGRGRGRSRPFSHLDDVAGFEAQGRVHPALLGRRPKDELAAEVAVFAQGLGVQLQARQTG
jgi:hypothetical protein